MNEFAVACRFGLAAIFLVAGVAKLARHTEFVQAVRNYQLLPVLLIEGVGFGLPPLEVAVGVLLFCGIEVALVAAVAAASLLAFSIAVSINLLRGRRIECGCFGVVAEERLTWLSVVRNLLLCLAVALVIWHPVSALTLPWRTNRDASLPPDTALALLVAATAVLSIGGLAQELMRLRQAMTPSSRGAR